MQFFCACFFFMPVKHIGFFFYHISLQDFFHTYICPYKQLARFFLICLFVHDIFSPYFFGARIFFWYLQWYLPSPPPPPLKNLMVRP